MSFFWSKQVASLLFVATTIGVATTGCGADATDENAASKDDGAEPNEVSTSEEALSACGIICGGVGARVCLPLKTPATAVACGIASGIACDAFCSPGKPRRVCPYHPGAICILYSEQVVNLPSGTIHPCKAWSC